MPLKHKRQQHKRRQNYSFGVGEPDTTQLSTTKNLGGMSDTMYYVLLCLGVLYFGALTGFEFYSVYYAKDDDKKFFYIQIVMAVSALIVTVCLLFAFKSNNNWIGYIGVFFIIAYALCSCVLFGMYYSGDVKDDNLMQGWWHYVRWVTIAIPVLILLSLACKQGCIILLR